MGKQLLWRHNAGAGKNGEFSLKCHSVPLLGTRQHLSHVAEGKREEGVVDWVYNIHTSAWFMLEWDIHLFAVRLQDPDTLLYTCTFGKRGDFFFFSPHLHSTKENTTDLKV